MTTEVISGQLGEIRAASTAGGGTALSTTATFIQLPRESYHVMLTPRNFSTAVVAQVALNPWLVVLKTTNGMTSLPTDYSEAAQDADAATDVVLSGLSTLANGDFVLVGSHMRFRGAYATLDSLNAVVSTLTVTYWDGTTWTTTSATDGTQTGGNTTMGQSGLVSWTVPTAWQVASISTLYPTMSTKTYYSDIPLYWTRWVVSVALTDPTTLDSLVAASRSTAYAELLSGQTLEQRIKHGPSGIGCVEALTNAGTANLIVNVATLRDGEFR